MLKNCFFLLLCICLGSCNVTTPKEENTIELIGIHHIELTDLKPCINVSFNGTLAQKNTLSDLLESDDMKEFRVDKTNENFYKDGMYDNKDQTGSFIYGVNYTIVLNSLSEKDRISELLKEKDIPANINSNGYFVSPETNSTLQDKAFQKALANAKTRITAYADSLDMHAEIIGVEELDDYQLYPVDGIVYNDKLIKKIKVKAHLVED